MTERRISPQGYQITTDPENVNPFWDDAPVPPGEGLPAGGTTGQVLTKSSDTDYDAEWEDPQAGEVDASLSSVSTNPVENRAIYAALENKQAKLTFDTNPTYGSQNPVTSSGVRAADVYTLNQAKAYTDEKQKVQGHKEYEATSSGGGTYGTVTLSAPLSDWNLTAGKAYRLDVMITGTSNDPDYAIPFFPLFSVPFVYNTYRVPQTFSEVVDVYVPVITTTEGVTVENTVRIYGAATGFLSSVIMGEVSGDKLFQTSLRVGTAEPTDFRILVYVTEI